jgi:ankyrin repeat protein
MVGSLPMVELLLEKGAKVDRASIKGETALQNAVSHDHDDIVVVLLAHGADPYKVNNKGVSAVDIARHKGNEDVLNMLLAVEPSPPSKPAEDAI